MASRHRGRNAKRTARSRAGSPDSLAATANTPATFTAVALTRCAWCGQPLRSLPFQMEGVVLCSDCYGSHHYQDRPGETVPASHGEESAPDGVREVVEADPAAE